MSESAQIINLLKRSLKTKGLTYRDLSKRVGLSEASIKRVFAEETFSLQRLESICSAIDMTVSELVRLAADSREPLSQYLTLDQEEVLATDPQLLACCYLLINGRDTEEIRKRMNLTERQLRALLVKLDAAGMIELLPKLKARLRVGPIIIWRTDGPVHRAYEQQVKTEFLRTQFLEAQEALHFRSAELSAASINILKRKLEQLARDFAELAALDVRLTTREKSSVALLLAFRPWVFSMFDSLSRAPGAGGS